MLHWVKEKKYLRSVTRYIAMFNSGRTMDGVDNIHKKKMEEQTFYGHLLRELRDVKKQMEHGFALEVTDTSSIGDITDMQEDYSMSDDMDDMQM